MLAAVGGGCALPALWYAGRSPRRSIDVRFWLSERAARHDGVGRRIESYVGDALGEAFDDVTVSAGGVVGVDTEHGFRVTRSGEWPRLVGTELAAARGLDPVDDVNLLVTDGPVDRTPAGAAVPHVASAGGARHLGSVPAREAVDDVVPYTTRWRVVQLLLHEVGHALGLDHDHGSIVGDAEATVASPMISAYAWLDERAGHDRFDADRSACGRTYPADRGGERRLSLSFSECAVARLRSYDGGLLP